MGYDIKSHTKNEVKETVLGIYSELSTAYIFVHNLRCELHACANDGEDIEIARKVIGDYVEKLPDFKFFPNQKATYLSILLQASIGKLSLFDTWKILYTIENQIIDAMKCFKF